MGNKKKKKASKKSNKGLEALKEYRRKVEAGEIERPAPKNPLEKAKENPTSLRFAVNAKCYECCAGENWRNRTRYCQIFSCPLWPVRPYGKGVTMEQCEAYTET